MTHTTINTTNDTISDTTNDTNQQHMLIFRKIKRCQ